MSSAWDSAAGFASARGPMYGQQREDRDSEGQRDALTSPLIVEPDVPGSIRNQLERFSKVCAAVHKASLDLGTSRDSHKLRDRINRKVREAQDQAQTLQQRFHDPSPSGEAATYAERIELTRLRKDFHELLGAFHSTMQDVQFRLYEGPPEDSPRCKLEHISVDGGPPEEDPLPGLRVVHGQVPGELDRMLEDERTREIQDINHQVHTINAIYRDLGEIVTQQQDHVDGIQNAVTTANDKTSSGVKQIESATRKTKRMNKCCFCLLCVSVIAALVLVAVIFYKPIEHAASGNRRRLLRGVRLR